MRCLNPHKREQQEIQLPIRIEIRIRADNPTHRATRPQGKHLEPRADDMVRQTGEARDHPSGKVDAEKVPAAKLLAEGRSEDVQREAV